MLRMLSLVALLAGAGCGGSEDGSDGGDDGDGDDGGGGAVVCEGEVSGDAAGGFVMCRSAANHYPDGSQLLEGRDGWLFTLVVGGVIGDVDPPLAAAGINFELAGEPATGQFDLTEAVRGVTTAFVSLEDDTFYDTLAAADLEIAALDQVTDQVIEGERVVSFEVSGSLEMTLDGAGGAQVVLVAGF